jgi:hypothetical protein
MNMRSLMWKAVAGVAVAVGLAGATQSASAATLYDSAGFEAPRFGPGALEAQDPVFGPWLMDTGSTSTAVVQSATVKSGSQAVRVDRVANANGDTRWAVQKPIMPSQRYVIVEWDMNVQQSTGVDFGPFFGVEAYDADVTTVPLIGSLGVDASTGDVLVQEGSAGAIVETGTLVNFGAFNHFALHLDYTTKTYQAYVNGVEVASEGFVDDPILGFSDAPIAALAITPDSVATASGTAFFDNYIIYTSAVGVPEPGGMMVLGLAVVGLVARRRR